MYPLIINNKLKITFLLCSRLLPSQTNFTIVQEKIPIMISFWQLAIYVIKTIFYIHLRTSHKLSNITFICKIFFFYIDELSTYTFFH